MVVTMFHVEVVPGNEEEFISNFQHRVKLVDSMKGFRGFKLLRNRDESNKFIVMTLWEQYKDFITWTESEQFRKAHEREGPPTRSSHLSVYEVVLSD